MLTTRYNNKKKFDSILREILVKEQEERYYICNNQRHRCGVKFSTKQSFDIIQNQIDLYSTVIFVMQPLIDMIIT